MQKTKFHLVLLILLFFSTSSCSQKIPANPESTPVSHSTWDLLLKKYVNQQGWVDYQGFRQDLPTLEKYLELLKANLPNQKNWSRSEELAYWINAYNAFTVKLVLDHYPVASIKDIGSALQVPFVNSVFDIRFIGFGDKMYDLNFIEHRVLRKKFDEPRIHFAVNCASVSCPPLLNQAYDAQKLDQQLSFQAKTFLNDPLRNRIYPDQLKLSKIFSWYKGDFTKNGSLHEFIRSVSNQEISAAAPISYLDYSWELNSQQNGLKYDTLRLSE